MAKVDITNNEIDYILRRPIKSGKFLVMDEVKGELEEIGGIRIKPNPPSLVDRIRALYEDCENGAEDDIVLGWNRAIDRVLQVIEEVAKCTED